MISAKLHGLFPAIGRIGERARGRVDGELRIIFRCSRFSCTDPSSAHATCALFRLPTSKHVSSVKLSVRDAAAKRWPSERPRRWQQPCRQAQSVRAWFGTAATVPVRQLRRSITKYIADESVSRCRNCILARPRTVISGPRLPALHPRFLSAGGLLLRGRARGQSTGSLALPVMVLAP